MEYAARGAPRATVKALRTGKAQELIRAKTQKSSRNTA